MLSIVFLVGGGLVVQSTWVENYGSKDSLRTSSAIGSLKAGLRVVLNDASILAVGMIVALYEGSMYTFVFLWGPVLEEAYIDKLPFGWIFASFMV